MRVNPSPIARRLLWHLYSLGPTRLTQTEYHEPFEKPGAHLFWVLSGQGALELESGRFSLKPGRSVWFVDMNQRRAYAPTPGKRLVTRKPVHWEWEVHLLLTQILGKLLVARGLLSSLEAESPIPVRRVLNSVEANPCRDWRARELAAIAGVSYSGLRALFRQTQGETLHDYLQRARLDQARQLLADLRLSVKEVAERLHFSSEFYFSHFFHRACGLTPTEFRTTLKR